MLYMYRVLSQDEKVDDSTFGVAPPPLAIKSNFAGKSKKIRFDSQIRLKD